MKNFTLLMFFALLFSVSNSSAQTLPIFTEGYAAGVSFAAFGGSTNNVTEDATVAYTGSTSLKIVMPAGNYSGGAFVASTPQNLSAYNALTFWIKADGAYGVNVIGIGNNSVDNSMQSEKNGALAVTTTWTKVVIPIPDPAKFTAATGLFHFAEGGEGVFTIWIDDIQYETVAVGTPTATMATESITKAIGGTFSPNGATCAFGVTSYNIMKSWFNYTSSNTAVATMNNTTGIGTAVAGGTTAVTATLGAVAVTGTLTVNVTAAAAGPVTAAPTPTTAAGNVTSLYSNAYTNVPVNTWSAVWDNADEADVTIAGNLTKKYTNHLFSGIEFVGANVIDATARTHFHADVWTADAAGANGFKVKLVDVGANGDFGGGDDAISIELEFTPTASGWFSVDAPLTAFTGLVTKAHLAQLLFVTPGGGKTFWVDNIYFYTAAVAPTTPTAAAPTPTRPAANVMALFSNTYPQRTIDTWRTSWSNATLDDVQIAGNDTKKYTNMGFFGAEFTGANLINPVNATHLHLDVWTPNAIGAGVFRVKLVDFGADGTGFGPADNTEGEVLNIPAIAAGTWTAIDIPLTDFMSASPALGSTTHLAQLIPSGGGTVFMDNIYFYAAVVLSAEMTSFSAKTVNTTTVLNWETVSEKDNAGFTIERSTNATNFTTIGTVKGNGTTNNVSNYTFTDNAPLTGLNYYRLRQSDVNGKESISKVVSVLFGKATGLFIKNTLVHDVLDVTVGDAEKGPLSIFNISGQLVHSIKAQGTQRLDLSHLSAGLYIIRLDSGEAKRFVKD